MTTYSINEYSGINSRDSELLKNKLDEELQQGLSSDSGTLEAWPFELSFTCITNRDGIELEAEKINAAISKAAQWQHLSQTAKNLTSIQEIAVTAATIMPVSQSHLHIWSGLEALFPTVTAELSFKISLYLSQLIGAKSERMSIYEQVRASYNLRSAITHGSRKDITVEEWQSTWGLLMQAVNSILTRGKMPAEKELLSEILT